MYLMCFDTNTIEWTRHDWATDLKPGPEAGLSYLCSLQDDNEESPPVGPIAHHNLADCFVLVAAWTYGRQWFKMLLVFSIDKLSDERAETLLTEYLPEAKEVEDEDEEG